MSEFRQNLATKEWVILAADRGSRPSDCVKERPGDRVNVPAFRADCPFCVGNESHTDAPSLVIPATGPWKVRVVPNRFAALQPRFVATRSNVGTFLSAKGYGIAEVLIEHPSHNLSPAQMTLSEVASILRAYRSRQITISADERINLVTIFRNHGPRAGTSLEHPHSQIIATPIVPPHVRYPSQQAVMHYDKYGTCVYCDVLKEELRQQERVIIESENFVAFCPYASRSPYECRIYPRTHQAGFILIDNECLDELASVLRELLARIFHCLGDPDYNYVFRSAPVGDHDTRHLHWYIVVIPKISTPAGFEIGSGIYINSVAPEAAAQSLRDVKLP